MFRPPDERTMVWNDVFNSLSSWVFCVSVALLKTGSLTLSKSSLAGSCRNSVATWLQIESKRASTLSWSVAMSAIHCHES